MPYTALDKTEAYSKLQGLAQTPFDLTADAVLNKERFQQFSTKAVSFQYNYATQRVNEEVIETLQSLADETKAVDQFKAMLKGEFMNKIDGFECENRQVLHGACRNVFADLNDEATIGDSVEAIEGSKVELEKLKVFLSELENGSVVNAAGQAFTDMVLVGIGGSDLGPRAIYLALKKYRQEGRRVHFISNVDPDDAADVLNGLDLSKTLVCVISKSGGTLETLTNEKLVAQRFESAGLDITKHFLCVTGKGSPMDNPAKYLRSFYMFDYIGGRYSVTSMVGAVCSFLRSWFPSFRRLPPWCS